MAVKKGEDRPSVSAKDDIREGSGTCTHIGYSCTNMGYMRNIEMRLVFFVYVGDFMPTDSRLSPSLKLANFDDNQGHVVGEGTVPPGSYTVEDRLLHIREW